jgi:hypothetical protein
MAAITDNVVIGLVKGRIGELMDRMDRERPELSQEDREAATVRLGQQEIALELASRPDLAKRFGDMAAECFLQAIVRELRSLRSV